LSVQSAKVLIVDDEADVIQALKLRLETAGYNAVTASDGAEALRLLPQVRPDLILADLMMPNLDGLELTRRIRQNPRWFAVQVLLLSCHDDPVARNLAIEFGALDYLSKTLGAPAIVSRVDEILSTARSSSASLQDVRGIAAAERDLMSQLSALSHNVSATLTVGTRLVTEGASRAAANAEQLRNLHRALGGTPQPSDPRTPSGH
jgi:DNA-binding response OmpR family regulator